MRIKIEIEIHVNTSIPLDGVNKSQYETLTGPSLQAQKRSPGSKWQVVLHTNLLSNLSRPTDQLNLLILTCWQVASQMYLLFQNMLD